MKTNTLARHIRHVLNPQQASAQPPMRMYPWGNVLYWYRKVPPRKLLLSEKMEMQQEQVLGKVDSVSYIDDTAHVYDLKTLKSLEKSRAALEQLDTVIKAWWEIPPNMFRGNRSVSTAVDDLAYWPERDCGRTIQGHAT